MKTPKLFLFDLDGTLTIEHRIIPSKTQETLQKMMEAGYLVSAATGNTFAQFKQKFGQQWTPNAPMILECGSRITTVEGNDITQKPFTPEVIDQLREFLRHKQVHFSCFYPLAGGTYDVYSHDEDYVRGRYGAVMGYITPHVDEFFDLMREKGATRFVIKKDSHHDFDFPQDFPALVARNEGVFEITMPGVHKGVMVEELAKHLNISMDEIVIAGNGYNDIDFFKYADVPTKIKVGDECPELSEWATVEVPNAIELAYWLEKQYL